MNAGLKYFVTSPWFSCLNELWSYQQYYLCSHWNAASGKPKKSQQPRNTARDYKNKKEKEIHQLWPLLLNENKGNTVQWTNRLKHSLSGNFIKSKSCNGSSSNSHLSNGRRLGIHVLTMLPMLPILGFPRHHRCLSQS